VAVRLRFRLLRHTRRERREHRVQHSRRYTNAGASAPTHTPEDSPITSGRSSLNSLSAERAEMSASPITAETAPTSGVMKSVIVGALALFVLGGIWFTLLFGKVYRRELGVPEPGADEGSASPGPGLGRALIGQLVAGFVMAVVLAWLVGNTSAGHGAGVGLAGGVLIAAAITQLYQFEGKSLRHLLINVGYTIVGVTAVGAILGAFQAP
jgi:MFS family permease